MSVKVFLSCSPFFCPDVFLVSLSLSLSLESASVIHFPQTSWGPLSLSPLSHSLFLSLLQCLSLPVRSGKNTAEGRNGILWPGATRIHTDNGGTSFLSAPPHPVQGLWSANTVNQGLLRDPEGRDPRSRGVWSRLDEEGGFYGLMSVSHWRKYCFEKPFLWMASMLRPFLNFSPLKHHIRCDFLPSCICLTWHWWQQ